MSHQCLADAFAPAEAKYREDVMRATWGHLAPEKHRSYHGFIVFAIGCYDSGELNPTPLSVEFKDLDDSPWFYDALHEMLGKYQIGFRKRKRFKVGGVYRWDGQVCNYKFKGKFRRLEVA